LLRLEAAGMRIGRVLPPQPAPGTVAPCGSTTLPFTVPRRRRGEPHLRRARRQEVFVRSRGWWKISIAASSSGRRHFGAVKRTAPPPRGTPPWPRRGIAHLDM